MPTLPSSQRYYPRTDIASRDYYKVKAKWGKLTADDLTAINGRREELEGKIQQHYGLTKDQVRKEVDAWFTSQGF